MKLSDMTRIEVGSVIIDPWGHNQIVLYADPEQEFPWRDRYVLFGEKHIYTINENCYGTQETDTIHNFELWIE